MFLVTKFMGFLLDPMGFYRRMRVTHRPKIPRLQALWEEFHHHGNSPPGFR